MRKAKKGCRKKTEIHRERRDKWSVQLLQGLYKGDLQSKRRITLLRERERERESEHEERLHSERSRKSSWALWSIHKFQSAKAREKQCDDWLISSCCRKMRTLSSWYA